MRQSLCAIEACLEPGLYPAPKSRRALLNREDCYWWLCLAHVRDYNRKWNYYAGMTGAEIDADRFADRYCRCHFNTATTAVTTDLKLQRALSVFNLDADYSLAALRKRYCLLVKSLHPDTCSDPPAAGCSGKRAHNQVKLNAVYEAYHYLRRRRQPPG